MGETPPNHMVSPVIENASSLDKMSPAYSFCNEGIKHNSKKDESYPIERFDIHDRSREGLSPFPLSNILSRRLSNMSTFSSASSSLDETTSDDEDGIADNEDDSAEPLVKMNQASKYSSSNKRKSLAMGKKPFSLDTKSNKKPSIRKKKNKNKPAYADEQFNQNNFKSIQKGIQNILNSDVLLKEDLETSHKRHNDYNTEDDEDSKDSSKLESTKDSLTHGVCNKKKAKALINCFRSFAAKPK